MINVSGENIYPSEIERHTNNYKDISLSIVLPISNKITQNSLVLIYENSKKKIKIEDLKNFLSSRISKFKIPKHIFHVNDINLPEIPKAPNKKILRNKIKNYFKDFVKKEQILL